MDQLNKVNQGNKIFKKIVRNNFQQNHTDTIKCKNPTRDANKRMIKQDKPKENTKGLIEIEMLWLLSRLSWLVTTKRGIVTQTVKLTN